MSFRSAHHGIHGSTRVNSALALTGSAMSTAGPLVVDFTFRKVNLEGVELALSRKEFGHLGDDPTAPRFIITEAEIEYRLMGP